MAALKGDGLSGERASAGAAAEARSALPPPDKARFDGADLLALMAFLRSEAGCAWDRAQTLESLRPYLLEECYEALAASRRGDRGALCEELGDVLLQVVFQAQIAAEEGAFDFGDVVDGLARKLIRRHSHIFGADAAADPAAVEALWALNKAKEKPGRGAGGTSDATRARFADAGEGLPPLRRALALQKEAAQLGFDWPDETGPFAKVEEELAELCEAAARLSAQAAAEGRGAPAYREDSACREELGDLIFAVLNLARSLKIEPEEALGLCNQKFLDRFAAMERLAEAEGLDFARLDLAAQDALWERVKAAAVGEAQIPGQTWRGTGDEGVENAPG